MHVMLSTVSTLSRIDQATTMSPLPAVRVCMSVRQSVCLHVSLNKFSINKMQHVFNWLSSVQCIYVVIYAYFAFTRNSFSYIWFSLLSLTMQCARWSLTYHRLIALTDENKAQLRSRLVQRLNPCLLDVCTSRRDEWRCRTFERAHGAWKKPR